MEAVDNWVWDAYIELNEAGNWAAKKSNQGEDKMSALDHEFSFAGFSFPKYAWNMPRRRGTVKQRLTNYKKPTVGSYYHAPTPNSKESSFYLDSDFMPGLRWQYADDVCRSIRHDSWYCDADADGSPMLDGDKIRGIVFRLPRSRGFLPGWTMGEGMSSGIDYSQIFDDEEDCAITADSIAENVADANIQSRLKDLADEREALRDKILNWGCESAHVLRVWLEELSYITPDDAGGYPDAENVPTMPLPDSIDRGSGLYCLDRRGNLLVSTGDWQFTVIPLKDFSI